MNKLNLILLLLIASCSLKKNELANQTQNGHEELYSEPSEISRDNEKGSTRVVIAATNDIGGNFGTQAIKIRDKHNKDALHIEVGGADFLASYLRILRDKYKSVVLVDSGDVLPSEPDELKPAQEFYSLLKYDALSPGLTDFSTRSSGKILPIKKFAETSSVPVLTSNLYELKTARGVEWKGTSQYQLKEVNGVKVGIIGMLPDDVSTLTPVDNRVGLFVENMLQSTLHQARRLRSLGAQVIVVLTHQGLECGQSIADLMKLPLTKVNFEPAKQGVCDMRSPLGEYLLRLPARLVDVVVAGRNHKKIANFVNGIAVISGFDSGKSFSYVELTVDEKSARVDPEKTVIHQPVMICREFFKETNDCYPEDPSINHKERVPAKFLGVQVDRDEDIRTKFKKFFDEVSVGFSIPVLERIRNQNADIAFVPENSGKSYLVVLELSGKELGRWLEKSYNEESAEDWIPSPFTREGEQISIIVHGEPLNLTKTYRVLADLESLQSRSSLRRFIVSATTSSLNEISWKGKMSTDQVSTAVGAIAVTGNL
ncbi:MAG: hypothetical protein ACJ76H_17430 [Bacteriovoracaceae bacterium]